MRLTLGPTDRSVNTHWSSSALVPLGKHVRFLHAASGLLPLASESMTPQLVAISIVTKDMAAAIAFYESCGLRLSSGGPTEPHSEFSGAGIRVMLDTRELIEQMHPGWQPP